MKLILRSIQLSGKNNVMRDFPSCMSAFNSLHVGKRFANVQSQFVNSIRYSFSKSKETQNNQRQQAESKNFKLQQLKQLFETKMNKYNLKGLLKMYQILRHNNIKLTEESLREFDYRLAHQLNSIDHHSTNSILEVLLKNGQTYHIKGKNKLLRGINIKLQKDKLNIEPQQSYKTIKLLIEMNFPKSTLNKMLLKLVIENQPNKRILYQIDSLNSLKICLITIQNVELQLELKKRVLENLLLIKPKGVVELSYFYSILKIVVAKLEETVNFQAQKRTVYDLAFNPYNFSYQVNEQSVEGNSVNQHQKNIDKNTQNDKNPHQKPNQTTSNTVQSSTQKPKVNEAILKNLINQKDKILQQTFQKFNIQKISQQIYDQLSEILNDRKNDEFEFKDKKQVAALLLVNKFKSESNKNKKLVVNMLKNILSQGLGESIKSSNDINSQKIIRVNEFMSLLEELSESCETQIIRSWIEKYKLIYYNLMSLEEKLMFLYFSARIINEKINISEIKSEISEIHYGLNASEFVWLHKVLSMRQEKHSQQQKQLVKDIWRHVENNLDKEIGELKRDKQEQKKIKQAQQQNEQSNQSQSINKHSKKDINQSAKKDKN